MPTVVVQQTRARRLAVVGNPNCGKTTLFNALTGLRQKVGNYPGVTVEKKEGVVRVPGSNDQVRLIDLPGLYSLTPRSPDEIIARDVLLGRRTDTEQPEGIVNIVDASNLERNLYLTSQLLELGLPMIVVLTMTDVAAQSGRVVSETALAKALGVPVVSVVVQKKLGLSLLPVQLADLPLTIDEPRQIPYKLPDELRDETHELAEMIRGDDPRISEGRAYSEAIGLLMTEDVLQEEASRFTEPVLSHVADEKVKFAAHQIDFASVLVESRYSWIEKVTKSVTHVTASHRGETGPRTTISERVDRVLLHRIWGYIIFFAVMMLIFQAVFTWAQTPSNWIVARFADLATLVQRHMQGGPLRDLLAEGVCGGVGTTIAFLPQILILFLFIGLLEDSGYLARAAFLMDRVMSKVGLHGKSFIPMLSSFACAIPGIMATRTIDDRKSRLVTILIAPLMSCSARLPVYTLMIGAFISTRYRGLTMTVMYLVGTLAAFGMAWVFKKTLLKSAPPRFFIELPPYHLPTLRTVLMQMLERSLLFLRRAGTVILAVSAVLWWLSSYPRNLAVPADQQLAHSYAGMMGHFIEPAIRPIGFDWRIGVSLVSSFVAREVFVSSMGTIYSVGTRDSDPDKVAEVLQTHLRHDPTFSPLLAVCVMIYYVLAMQCLSTIAVVYRETNGWKWPMFMLGYMTALAWCATFIVWHIGNALHLGIH